MGENTKPGITRLNLRHTFVAMLFALAAGQIAVSASDLFLGGSLQDWGTLAASFTHLLLASVVLTASWVSWSVTALDPETEPLQHVFQRPHAVLFLDVSLVILYYMIARSVEFDSDAPTTTVASAMEEARLLLLIFAVYLVWDLLHDVWKLKSDTKRRDAFVLVSASLAAIVVAAIVLGVYSLLEDPHNPTSVVFADIALVCTVFGFRAFKRLEEPLNNWLQANAPIKDRPYPSRSWAVGLVLVYVVSLVAMHAVQLEQSELSEPTAISSS